MARRVLSLWMPRLASDLALRRLGEVPGAFAIVTRKGPADVLACLTPATEVLGLRRGQSLTEARALQPGLVTRPHDAAGQARALAVLRRWALRYAPWVAVDGDDGLVIDLTGAAHLMGGEGPLAEDMLARLAAMGIEARIAVAPTRGAAWALARYGQKPVVLVEDARAALAPLPLAALRLPADTVAGLARLGLRQVRDLERAQRASLARRFGEDLTLRLDQALGVLAEPVAAPVEDVTYAVRMALPEPIGLTSDVMAGLERLLARLCTTLAAKERGARRLRLELRRADGGRAEAELALARPMRDAPAMAALFERAVETLDAGFGFDAMRLSAPVTEALPAAQLTSGTRLSGNDDLADLMTRLGNRLGLEALERHLPADSHIPERAFQRAAAAFTEAPGAAAWRDGPDRPLVLFPPEPLMPLGAGTPPERFRWRRRSLRTARVSGPERLTPEWWFDDPLWRGGVRDYWRVDTSEGARLWVFHTPQEPAWAVQGEFA